MYNEKEMKKNLRVGAEKGETVMKKFVTFLLSLCLAAALPLCSFSACDDGGSSVPPPVQGGGENGGGDNGGGENGGGDNGGDGGFEIGPY